MAPNPASRAPEDDTKVIQVPEQYTAEWVQQFHRALLVASRQSVVSLRLMLPSCTVMAMLQSATALLETEPTLVKVDPRDKKVMVFGDTHGQLHDVLKMLEELQAYSSDHVFVFNGDYVDRGSWGVELFLALATLKLARPKSVFMLRGNHESGTCTSVYGFLSELKAKYKKVKRGPADVPPRQLYTAFKDAFKALPLGALVSEKTLIVHGGLWRKPQKAKPRNARKRRKVDAEACAVELGTLGDLQKSSKGGVNPIGSPAQLSSMLASDVLWSDPVSEAGIEENSARGVGLVFGPDKTEEFLRENNLRLFVRSHEGPDARYNADNGMAQMDTGYTLDHDTPAGRLVTVFSAPDYPQFQDADERFDNKASVLILKPPTHDTYDVITFCAAERPEGQLFYSLEQPASDEEVPEEVAYTDTDMASQGGTCTSAATASIGGDTTSLGAAASADDAANESRHEAADVHALAPSPSADRETTSTPIDIGAPARVSPPAPSVSHEAASPTRASGAAPLPSACNKAGPPTADSDVRASEPPVAPADAGGAAEGSVPWWESADKADVSAMQDVDTIPGLAAVETVDAPAGLFLAPASEAVACAKRVLTEGSEVA